MVINMKLLIASDIHGSLFYCKKLVESMKRESPNRVIFLGDILYHGPRNDLPKEYNPKEVIKLLNSLDYSLISVRGNCEAEVDQMVLNFPVMADYCLLPLEDKTIFLTHGHIFNENNLPKLNKGDILLCGHTHVQKCVEYENYTYLNCGSVSIPKEDGFNGYMIIDTKENKFYWKDLEGNIKKTY